jgi:hypothetical protein
MYNAWSRSSLRAPNNLDVDFICAPAYHASSFSSALLAICRGKSQLKAVILDVSATEPQIATSIDIESPEQPISDVAWGPEGKFYLLRSGGSAGWRVESYQLEIYANGEGPSWSLQYLGEFSSSTISVTGFAVQSRLGGLILGCDTGELYHKEGEGSGIKRLGRWCKDAVSITKVKRDRLIACVSEMGRLSLALASNSAPQILELFNK